MNYHPKNANNRTFYDIRQQFLRQERNPEDYLEDCLQAIQNQDDTVRAWVILNEEGARQAAQEAAQRYQRGNPLSPIDGLPIGIKDLIETKDMPTQMGCAAFDGHFPKVDAAAVQALRAAGAIILGKTVTTALGFLDPGPTRNPFDPQRTPGGSSSGSAAAVAADMVPAAMGSQLIGSVIRPASFCGNWGYKPTFGALSRGERLTYSQSHLGVHANHPIDLWSVAYAISSRVGGDPNARGLYGPADAPAAYAPARLAVVQGEAWERVSPTTLEQFEHLLEHLKQAGVQIIRRADNPLLEHFEQLIAESASLSLAISAWEQRASLKGLIQNHPGVLGPKQIEQFEKAQRLSLDEHRLHLHKRDIVQLAHQALAPIADGLITLSAIGPAPNAKEALHSAYPTGDVTFSSISSILWAPSINLPLLVDEQLPVGVQLIGQQQQDALTMAHARWIAESYLAH